MTELEGLIRFWESTLRLNRFVMGPSVIAHVESTIMYLKQLDKLLKKTKTQKKV